MFAFVCTLEILVSISIKGISVPNFELWPLLLSLNFRLSLCNLFPFEMNIFDILFKSKTFFLTKFKSKTYRYVDIGIGVLAQNKRVLERTRNESI